MGILFGRHWTPQYRDQDMLEGATDQCADCGTDIPAGDLYCDDCGEDDGDYEDDADLDDY